MIKVRYSSVDGAGKARTFQTVESARKFAVRYVGETPEFGSHYAVSGDGVGKVTVEGCTLAELFGRRVEREPVEEDLEAARLEASFEAEHAAYMAVERDSNGFPLHRAPGCKCSVAQLERVGCDCGCDELVALHTDDPEAPTEYAPRGECESHVVDGDWQGPNEFGGSTFRPIHGWFRKADLARWAAEAAERAARPVEYPGEIPF